jgi:hypothetical protein
MQHTEYMNMYFNWQETAITKIRSALFSDVHRAFRSLLYLLFAALVVHSFVLVNEVASNHIFADAWRHLVQYYIKWEDGTFEVRDLFSDHHPNALSAILYLINAEYFSLQFKYQAFNGMVFKMLLGLLVTYFVIGLIRDRQLPLSSRALVYSIAVYLLLMFYGLNAIVEYAWYLVAESHVIFLSQFLFLISCDHFLRGEGSVFRRYMPVFILSIVLYLSSITGIKLTIAAVIFALLPVLFISNRYRLNASLLISGLLFAYIAISVFVNYVFDITLASSYEFSFEKVALLLENAHNVFLTMAGGLTVGFVSNGVVNTLLGLGNGAFLAATIIAFFLFVIFAFYIFYKHKMWDVSFVPIFLATFLLAFVMAAIIFRSKFDGDISILKGWPLNVPRYMLSYHIGIMGILMIYIMYFSRYKTKSIIRYAVSILVAIGIIHQLYGFHGAWKTAPYIVASQTKAIKQMCLYKDNKDVKLHRSIARGAFSPQNFDYLVANKLNVFAENGPGDRCSPIKDN